MYWATSATSPAPFSTRTRTPGYAHGSQVGISGIEAQYETYLRGVNGRQALEVDASGNVVGTVSSTAPQTGDTVVLNIDTGLQQAVEADLANQITSDRQTPDKLNGNIYPPAKDGAVIVMNPQNGQILAMASNPSYDLNEWVGGISSANYTALQASGAENNNAIQGLFIPGSTFKLITATADLQDGVYDPNQYFSDTGSYTVPGCTGGAGSGCTFHDDQDSGAGSVNLPQALSVSSDAYFYQLGDLFWQGRAKYGTDAIQNVGGPVRRGGHHRDRSARRGAGPHRQPLGGTEAARPGPRRASPTPRTGTPATTSRWPSVRVGPSSPPSSRRWPTPPSPTGAPATSPRWRRPSSIRSPARW